MILKDWSRLSNAHPRCSRARVNTIYLNPRVSLSGHYVVILSPTCSPGVGAQITDSALPSFARKGRSKKGTTGRETFSDGQVGGAHGRQGQSGAGGEVGRGRESRAIACDSLCRFLVLTYDSPTLNERGWKKFLLPKSCTSKSDA